MEALDPLTDFVRRPKLDAAELDKDRGVVNPGDRPLEGPALRRVMFEFGYFSRRLGASKTAIIRYNDFYTPTDLAGYTHITGSEFPRRQGDVCR